MAQLNCGCGDWRAVDWINMDRTVNDRVMPDVRALATALPFRTESISRIYAGHVLEHLTVAQVVAAGAEFARVLTAAGQLCVVGPDYDAAQRRYPHDVELLRGIAEGGHRWPGDEHTWLPTAASHIRLLRRAGWAVTQMPLNVLALQGWPIVSLADWQCGFFATRVDYSPMASARRR